MLRTFLAALLLTLLAACPKHSHAQHPSAATTATAPAADTMTKKMVGTWEGTFKSDHGPAGSMTLAVSRDSEWRATIELTADQKLPPSKARDFRIVGTDVTWEQDLMNMPCKSNAVLEGAVLRGDVDCGHGGLSFELRKRRAP